MIELYNQPMNNAELIGNALKEISRRLREYDEQQRIASLGLEQAYKSYDTSDVIENLSALSYSTRSNTFVDNDISSLKRRINFAKSPLEKKSLERKLNLAFKDKKRKAFLVKKEINTHGNIS